MVNLPRYEEKTNLPLGASPKAVNTPTITSRGGKKGKNDLTKETDFSLCGTLWLPNSLLNLFPLICLSLVSDLIVGGAFLGKRSRGSPFLQVSGGLSPISAKSLPSKSGHVRLFCFPQFFPFLSETPANLHKKV